MSYQFEDESALEELLNQQLDKRKQQSASKQIPRASSRPTTSVGLRAPSAYSPSSGPSASAYAKPTPRRVAAAAAAPDDADDDGEDDDDDDGAFGSDLTAATVAAGDGTPRGRLSSWLKRPSATMAAYKGGQERAASSQSLSATTAPLQDANAGNKAPDLQRDEDLLEMLASDRLQEMSKQRLIQVVLEKVVPRLGNLIQSASKQSAQKVAKLSQELATERNRLQVLELRQEEQLKLEQQKWAQITRQLEARLETSEHELVRLMDSQRGHLNKLEEQYQGTLAKMNENFQDKLKDERRRFEEMLKQRDEFHRIELDSKLQVNCDLDKLDTIQREWRRSLEATIQQLRANFESVEQALDKQSLQVNGTNIELARKAQALSEHYKQYDQCNQELSKLASQLNELMPQVSRVQFQGDSVLEQIGQRLAQLAQKFEQLEAKERELEQARSDLSKAREVFQEDKLQLALDANRVQMKEERLDELFRSNSEHELKLKEENKIQLEQQTQIHIKRVHLDERAADLKDQNYALHLLRKRLTNERDQLHKTQAELADERKLVDNQRLKITDESKRLTTLCTRARRELDQLRRLQQALVCSLCMSRLFDGDMNSAFSHNQPSQKQDLNIQQLQEEVFGARALGRFGVTSAATAGRQGKTAAPLDNTNNKALNLSHTHIHQLPLDHDNEANNGHDFELKRTQLETTRLDAECKYIEQLLSTA